MPPLLPVLVLPPLLVVTTVVTYVVTVVVTLVEFELDFTLVLLDVFVLVSTEVLFPFG